MLAKCEANVKQFFDKVQLEKLNLKFTLSRVKFFFICIKLYLCVECPSPSKTFSLCFALIRLSNLLYANHRHTTCFILNFDFSWPLFTAYWFIWSSWNADFSCVTGRCVWSSGSGNLFRFGTFAQGHYFETFISLKPLLSAPLHHQSLPPFHFHLWVQLFILLPVRLLLTWLKENWWNDITNRSKESLVLRWYLFLDWWLISIFPMIDDKNKNRIFRLQLEFPRISSWSPI